MCIVLVTFLVTLSNDSHVVKSFTLPYDQAIAFVARNADTRMVSDVTMEKLCSEKLDQ